MHKKLFTAVLALGFLLLGSVTGFARNVPFDGVERPVNVYGNGQSKSPGSRVALDGAETSIEVQAGSARTVPGTYCQGYWMGPQTYRIPNWLAGNEVYAVYQDPDGGSPYSWDPACVPAPTNYTFDVTSIIWHLTARNPGAGVGPYPYTLMIQPLTFGVDPLSLPGCPLPGAVHCAGPLYAVEFNNASAAGITYILSLPFPVECCETGPYFAGTYVGGPNPNIGLTIQLLFDDGGFYWPGPVPGQLCRTYNDYGAGWCDLNDPAGCLFAEINLLLYSDGYTPEDLATHCNPGTCEYSFAYQCADLANGPTTCAGGFDEKRRFEDGNDDWFTGFVIRDPILSAAAAAQKWGVRFDAIGLDTLKEFKFLTYDGFTGAAGPDDLLVEVWDEGPAAGCNGEKYPNSVIYSVAIPAASVVYYPTMNTVPLPDITFGTLNGGPEQSLFVTVTVTSGATGSSMGYPTTVSGCPVAPIRAHSLLWYPNHGGVLGNAQWRYVGDRTVTPGAAGHFEFWMDGLICREVLPAIEGPCIAPADDEWRNFAHDNRQTSASTIDVGDPNGVILSWSLAQGVNNNFSNPSVANDLVYATIDNAVNAYDLSTGALVGTHSGGPEMSASANRGNTTIAFVRALPVGPDRDVVFTTGGTFNSISAWETNLEGSAQIWSRNPASPPSLGQQNRFNTSKVVDVGGQDVLFVCTEPVAGGGRIWALNANDGALFAGWATNPVLLDAAAKHGPAVSGGKLYVGTAIGGSNVAGSLYQIDAATGTIDWNFVGNVGEGWPSGVSLEGDFIYGASKDAGNNAWRYKIDKSGALPSVVWTASQGTGLYGTPTIGRGFVYFPLDNPSSGLLQVDKNSGVVARNYALTDNICGASVFQIPQIVTLSCDAYLFAGDRNGRWWLLNAVDGTYEWYREFPGVVMGTALASAASGDDYAVVSTQGGGPGSIVATYLLNGGSRPRLIQCDHDETVIVPLGAGPGNPYATSDDVFVSIGDMDVNFASVTVSDPLPGLAAAGRSEREAMSRLNDASREFDGYSAIATASTVSKRHILAGLDAQVIDGGESSALYSQLAKRSDVLAPRSSNTRSMAASASAIRTSNVLIGGAALPMALTPGSSANLSWDYDGTGLGRAQDANDLEFVMDDPDFNWDGSNLAFYHILYVGGCLPASDTLHFNNNGSFETVYNNGALGDDGADDDWHFAADGTTPGGDLYDMGFFVIGDSIAGGLVPDFGAEVFNNIYTELDDYVANVAPVSGVCGFDKLTNIALGTKRTGGCPGTPVDIFGEMITHSMSDTDFAATLGSPASAIGLDIVQTEVGAYDPLYGDFKLIQWHVQNRDAVAKGPLYLGSQADWDINGGTNTGLYSDNFNGYVLWGGTANTIGYGSFDPNLPSSYAGVDPSANSPHKLWVLSNPTWVYTNTWDWGDEDKKQLIYNEIVGGLNRRIDPQIGEDISGQITHKAINLAPSGSANVHQAVFGVDATSNNAATIEANAVALAKRASRWAGFARGDVNDDGLVDLADVCWLQGGNHIYPDAYSGDVDADGDNDAADVARLLSYVSGNAGDQPAGAWRF